jgi:hypothetical protein
MVLSLTSMVESKDSLDQGLSESICGFIISSVICQVRLILGLDPEFKVEF